MGRPGLSLHRKFKHLARALDSVCGGMGKALARGLLEHLWEAAYQNGDDYLGAAADVEDIAGWHGEQGILVAALLSCGGGGLPGFIDEDSDSPGHYRVHDLFDHAPDYVRKRLKRELERRAQGVTIKAIRQAAARKSHETRNVQTAVICMQTAANGKHLHDPHIKGLGANVRPFAANDRHLPANGATPAPAPAPAPAQIKKDQEKEKRAATKPKRQRSDNGLLDIEGELELAAIYELYPRHRGRADGFKSARKKEHDAPGFLSTLRQSVVKFRGENAAKIGTDDEQYFPHFSTFVNGKYEDYIPTPEEASEAKEQAELKAASMDRFRQGFKEDMASGKAFLPPRGDA